MFFLIFYYSIQPNICSLLYFIVQSFTDVALSITFSDSTTASIVKSDESPTPCSGDSSVERVTNSALVPSEFQVVFKYPERLTEPRDAS